MTTREKTSLNAKSEYFTSWDKTRIHYQAWLPATPADRAVLYCHRGHEYGGRWRETVERLDLPGFAHFAWDARGHGDSEGERGHAPGVAAVAKDLDCFARHVSAIHGIPMENIVVVGHSVGAVIAAAWVHDFAPPIRGMILGAPAFRVKLYVPLAIPLLRLRQALFGEGEVRSYVKAGVLTHDRAEAEDYTKDPKIFPQISVRMLLDLYDTSTRLLDDAGAIQTPTLLLTAGSDWVVKLSAQEAFFDGLSAPVKKRKHLEGFFHALFHEKERAKVVTEMRAFIDGLFAQAPVKPSLLEADRRGYTKQEYDRLCGPGPWHFEATRKALHAVGPLSTGVALGLKTGFDSGVTLDYVYRNQPQGRLGIGKLIDTCYLESVGWRGIRQRRAHLEQRLDGLVREVAAERGSASILDIATGGGRYVLETLKRNPDLALSAYLQDYKEVNIESATRLRDEWGLKNAEIRKGDAFDLDGSVPAGAAFDIGIVSGLFELFPSNAPVRKSLGQVAARLRPGGYLLYTNQPWHPQLEFIARVLGNREGHSWIMRRRTQAEMDQLVAEAGLAKQDMDIDGWGIFTVSVAKKPL